MATRKVTPTPAATGELFTIEEIAKLADSTLGSVRYAIKSRDIQPTKRVGANLMMFDAAGVERIKAAVAESQAYRTPLGRSAARLMS